VHKALARRFADWPWPVRTDRFSFVLFVAFI